MNYPLSEEVPVAVVDASVGSFQPPLPAPIEVSSHRIEPVMEFATYQTLGTAFVSSERAAGWIFSGVLLLAGAVGVIIAAFVFSGTLWIQACIAGAYVVFAIFLSWMTHSLPRWTFETTKWKLDTVGFEIQRGIFWKHVISIPRARVQHTDVAQGPIMRQFQVAKLVVHTAGTSNASIELNGLPVDVAHQIRDSLISAHTIGSKKHG